jgi:hypothetical protein
LGWSQGRGQRCVASSEFSRAGRIGTPPGQALTTMSLPQLSACHAVNTNIAKGDEEDEKDAQRQRRERARKLDIKAGDLTCLFVAFGLALQ